MAKSKVKIHRGAIRKLMQDPKVLADLKRRGEAIAAAANAQSSWGGYYSGVSEQSGRPSVRVWNIKQAAADDEARNNRLIRSLDAGR